MGGFQEGGKEEDEENFLRLSILSSSTGCGSSKKSHISSKAKDPHPLASSGLISFCGLLKDIFFLFLVSPFSFVFYKSSGEC